MFDKRAQDTLFKAHWRPGHGWQRQPVAVEDFEYAKSRGYMFDPVVLSHDQIVDKLIEERAIADKTVITEAFLASLSTRRLAWRSALGSYGFARHFPAHRIKSSPGEIAPSGSMCCLICGQYETRANLHDLSILNFEKHKWGGVRRTQPDYAWFDLHTARLDTPATATGNDKAILRNILAVARSMPARARVSELAKSLKGVLPSADPERRMLIEILAVCSILQPKGRPGFFNSYSNHANRDRPSDGKNDWNYPAIWWTGADGVNETALAYWFPGL